jgi:putative transposase
MSKSYPSNLTRDQFEVLRDLIPEPKPGGRPRSVDLWSVLNAIFYILCEGCQWRALPGDFPPWQTMYTYFRNWRNDHTWVRIHDTLRVCTRLEAKHHPSPSESFLDRQSVKSAVMVNQAVGFDAGRLIHSRKRFMSVDTLGLVLRVS